MDFDDDKSQLDAFDDGVGNVAQNVLFLVLTLHRNFFPMEVCMEKTCHPHERSLKITVRNTVIFQRWVIRSELKNFRANAANAIRSEFANETTTKPLTFLEKNYCLFFE